MSMNMDAVTLLKEVRALLSDPDHWTKGEFARDESGGGVRCPLFRRALLVPYWGLK